MRAGTEWKRKDTDRRKKKGRKIELHDNIQNNNSNSNTVTATAPFQTNVCRCTSGVFPIHIDEMWHHHSAFPPSIPLFKTFKILQFATLFSFYSQYFDCLSLNNSHWIVVVVVVAVAVVSAIAYERTAFSVTDIIIYLAFNSRRWHHSSLPTDKMFHSTSN